MMSVVVSRGLCFNYFFLPLGLERSLPYIALFYHDAKTQSFTKTEG